MSEPTTMTYRDYADAYDFGVLNSESYWGDDFSSDVYLRVLEREAIKEGIKLTHFEEFDYEDYFWEVYKSDRDKACS